MSSSPAMPTPTVRRPSTTAMAASPSHSRNASDEATASMSYILEHVLQYPGSYEIPLRTMYTLNCVPRAQPLPKDLSPNTSASTSPTTTHPPAWNAAESTTMSFTSQLMTHLDSLPTQPSSLPPTFIVNFVTRCFHPTLSLVDFPQALTALDYLRDLENRRRKEMVAAFERVHIHADSYEADMDTMAESFPGIALWVRNVEGKNRKCESYYAQLWLGVRRWIMINELSIQPFNKLNCMGMLNTLLPPMHASSKLPSPLLDQQTLKEEREAFFDYIRHVQKSGPAVLKPVIEMCKGPEEETGWPAVQRVIDKYLKVSKSMIDDCMSTTGPESFKVYSDEPRKGKKTDSGVSFGSERRPSAACSVQEKDTPELSSSFSTPPKGATKLERITREFKRMRVKPRPSVEEIVQVNQRPAPADTISHPEDKGKKVKKSRSFASLRFGNGSAVSLASRKGSDASDAFDPEQMKAARKLYEASVKKSTA